MAIKWTPWNVPMRRRCEAFWAGFPIFVALFLGPISIITMCYLLWAGNIYLKTICILYLAFIYYDRHTGDTGGRGVGVKWFREWFFWKHILNYFPIDLVKTVDFPADRHYLIGLFPHGVLCQGALSFGTNHSKWPKLFPNIRSKFTGLAFHMHLPISREIVMGWGVCSPSKNAITTLLSQSNDPKDPSNRDGHSSNAVIIAVGGAEEAFSAIPNKYRFVLKNRKGFVKIALKTGAPLVPAISFGENNIYELVYHPPGSLFRKFQDFVKRITGVAPVHINGRGLLQYNFGMIPRRHPITIVIGKPIEVTKTLNPSINEIDQLHAKFCQCLIDLFETNKSKYVEDFENVYVEII